MIGSRLRNIQPILAAKALPTRTIDFGPWAPDLPDYANPGAIEALNVLPYRNSYQPFPGLSAQTNAADGLVLGAIEGRDDDGNVFIYLGDSGKLYEIVSNTISDQSKGGGYSTASGDIWSFVQFGDKIIASNFSDAIQSITVGTGSSTDFADHITSTNKPTAKYMDVVREFLVLGHTNDTTDGEVSNRIWWSAINDSTDFDPDAATQCDFSDIATGGRVTRVVGGVEYGVVFQEKQINRMTYTGPPLIFTIEAVDRQRGTPIPNSVCAHGRNIFYYSEEGFFRFNGIQSEPIGDGLVDKTFQREFDVSNKERVSCAIDPVNKLYLIAYPGSGGSVGVTNKLLACYWPERKWSEIELGDFDILLRAATQGFTLEGLDSISTDIDAGVLESFDSDAYKGGRYRLSAFDSEHKLAYFTGANLKPTLATRELQLTPGRRSKVRSVRPIVDGGTWTIQVGSKTKNTDTASFTTATSLSDDGEAHIIDDNRYHRFRAVGTAGDTWENIQGVEVEYSPTGTR